MSTKMQYRKDPKSNNELSVLGFGCMRFPNNSALCEELITTAIRGGVNYFDTAHLYVGSEATLGGILKKHHLREQVYIADKLPHFRCKGIEDIERFFSESLNRLQTEYIDYYLIHNLGSIEAFKRLEGYGIREWIKEKKEKGLIHRIGFSFHGKGVDFEKVLDAYDWDFCQIQYNYMCENYQAGTKGLKAIGERNMAAIIMEPLLGGRLAQNLPSRVQSIFDKAEPNRSAAAWAFRWLYNKKEVTVVLSGMNAMEQLLENLEIARNTPAGSLTDAEFTIYDKVSEEMAKAYKVPCTGCSYCMPCPSGVNIPACFSAYNMSYIMGYMSGIGLYMSSTMSLGSVKRSGSSSCTKCGVCLSKCPQGIDIPTQLKYVGRRLEPQPLRVILNLAKRIMK